MRWLLEPYADPAFYRITAYLLLGLPLGIFEYVVVVTGLSLGFGLAITLLGIPVILATLLLTSALAAFERDLAANMLGARMPRRILRRDVGGFGWMRFRVRMTDRRTWLEIAFFVLVRLPLAIAGFTIVVTSLYLALGIVIQPILVATGATSQFGEWTIDTYAESMVFAPLSVLFLLVGPRIVLGWADITSRITTGMLGWLATAEIKGAVVDVLARVGSADAFAIFDQIGLMLGKGQFLTPTRLEATLLALESTGRIIAVRGGDRTRYSLTAPAPVR